MRRAALAGGGASASRIARSLLLVTALAGSLASCRARDPAPESPPPPGRVPTAESTSVALHTPAPGPLHDLGWLSGCWQGRDGDMIVEETWTDPCADRMLATGRTVDAATGRTAFFEFLRIEARGDRLVYIALPRGRGETAFPATKVEAHRLRFENPEHDDPKVIEYRLEADGTLVTRVEGTRVEEIHLRRVW
jgi:uncharacterized protein DUF6265